MKKLLLILVAVVMILSLSGCTSHKVNTERQEVLKIARSIPLPTLDYNSETGHKYVYGKMECKVNGYMTDTGEPIFAVVIEVHDSNWFSQFNNWNYSYYKSLLIPDNKWSVYKVNGYYTLDILKQHQSELVWK